MRGVVRFSLAAWIPVAVFLTDCSTLPNGPVHLMTGGPVQIVSSDPVLRDVLCRHVVCGPGPEIYVEIAIYNPSSDILRNELLSLATLTTGLFVTHSADVSYQIRGEGLANMSGKVRVRQGLWFVLPFYMGFLGTNLGTALNSYRDPAHLQHYCIREEPDRFRVFFEGEHNRLCEDYELFLEAFAQELRPELQAFLKKSSDTALSAGDSGKGRGGPP